MTARTLGELLDEHIRLDHRVACVGAFSGIVNDPSVLYACTLARGPKGRVTIIDAQSRELESKMRGRIDCGRGKELTRGALKKYWKITEHAGGRGNPELNRRELLWLFEGKGSRTSSLNFNPAQEASLRRQGFRLPSVCIRHAGDTRLPDKHFNVLLDFGSLEWMKLSEVVGAIGEYRRISGKTLIALRPDLVEHTGSYNQWIEDAIAGLKPKRIQKLCVNNHYSLRLPGLAEPLKLQHSYGYDHVLVIDW
ncbi:MAG: hypothetical protein AABW54_01675 [Candidatus Micrarchaeota archaeon]